MSVIAYSILILLTTFLYYNYITDKITTNTPDFTQDSLKHYIN